jgi:hypothetical protein
MGGAVADPAAWALGSNVFKGVGALVKNAKPLVKALAPSMAAGGVVSAAAIPTEEGLSGADFAAEKAKQAVVGTLLGGVFAGLLMEVVSEEDGDALLDGAARFRGAEDDGGFGPLGELVLEGDLYVFKLAVAEPAGLLGGEANGANEIRE